MVLYIYLDENESIGLLVVCECVRGLICLMFTDMSIECACAIGNTADGTATTTQRATAEERKRLHWRFSRRSPESHQAKPSRAKPTERATDESATGRHQQYGGP